VSNAGDRIPPALSVESGHFQDPPCGGLVKYKALGGAFVLPVDLYSSVKYSFNAKKIESSLILESGSPPAFTSTIDCVGPFASSQAYF
jgi:hypothetical protein